MTHLQFSISTRFRKFTKHEFFTISRSTTKTNIYDIKIPFPILKSPAVVNFVFRSQIVRRKICFSAADFNICVHLSRWIFEFCL
jgi:hypothetical protein